MLRVQSVALELERRIVDGIYAVDERLPTEPQLATEFSVSRTTIRSAVSDLQARGLVVRSGTLMDATLVEAAVKKPSRAAGPGARGAADPDADWTMKNGRSHYGYKAHVGVDQGSGLIRRAELTSAKVSDGQTAERLICGDERAVYGDRAYEHKDRRRRLKAAGIKDRILHRRHKHQVGLPPWQAARNRLIGPIRAAVERTFGTLKRTYGYRRVRYRGLEANRIQFRLLCIAFNLRKAEALMP